MLKAAVLGHAIVERVLPRVPKRRVAQVVRQRHGFDQVFVQAQGAGNGPPQLRDFKRVREPRAEQIAFVVEEHLCFVNQPPECGGVHDAVAVTLESVARGRRRLSKAPPPAVRRVAGQCRQAGQWLA